MSDQTAFETGGIKIALAGYAALLALQLAGYASTGIVVLLAMALETLASFLVAGFLLLAAYYSRRPADDVHMLGYGRAQNVAALVSAVVFISFMSLETFRQAIPKLFDSTQANPANTSIAMIVAAVSLVVSAIPLVYMSRVKAAGASSKAQFVSSLEDVVAYGLGLFAIFLVSRGYYLADPVTAIVVAIFIAFIGLYLLLDNARYLVGKSPSKDFLRKLQLAAESVPGVLDAHNIRAEFIGPETVHSHLHLRVAVGTPIEEVDRIVREVRLNISLESGCQHAMIQVESENTDPDSEGVQTCG